MTFAVLSFIYADFHCSLQHTHKYPDRASVWDFHVKGELARLKPCDRMEKRTFDGYVACGTRYAALGRAGTIYFLMAIAASDNVTRIKDLPADQIQPLCEHIMNPTCAYSLNQE